jgi:hypothetical protein
MPELKSTINVGFSPYGKMPDPLHPRLSAVDFRFCYLPIANCCSFRSVSSVQISGKNYFAAYCW